MPSLRVSLSDSRKHSAWAGEASDLRPVLDSMEAQYASMRSSYIADKTEWERASVGRAEQSLQEIRDKIAARREEGLDASSWEVQLPVAERRLERERVQLDRQRATAENFDKIHVEVRTRKGANQTVTGRPAEIVEFLTHADVRDLTLQAPSGSIYSHRISVEFGRDSGVAVRVTSDDERWARAALSQVDEAVERKVPWWRGLRSSWLISVVVYLTAYVLALGVSNLVGISSAGWWSIVCGILAGCVTLFVSGGLRALLPAFELTSGAPRTRTVFFTLAAWFISVVLGVLTNTIHL